MVTVSGVASAVGVFPPLGVDEMNVLHSYRRIRDEGFGFLFIEFQQHRVTKYEIKFAGQQSVLNRLLGVGE